ncbi:MAG: OmpP1/FadL family transporter [Candidatus Electronema sp. V4]|uniref:OmpP1/FadL family transporter n=1 Tax=Candidatus Electronema sp. V4 TaxID=3454756 RepID=UPI00405539B4
MLHIEKKAVLLSVCAASLLLGGTAWGNPHGLSDDSHWTLRLPFDLEPAELSGGARSLGMGNAFAAVADDVRAAALNPAGLTALERMEFAADLGYSSYELAYRDGNAARNSIGLGPALGEISSFDDSSASLPFFGAAMPVIPDRLTAAFYIRSSSFEAGDSRDSGQQTVFSGLNLRQQHLSDKQIEEYLKRSYGLAAGFKHSRTLSFGAAASLETLNADMSETWDSRDFSGKTFSSAIRQHGRIDGDDSALGFSAGVLFKPMSDLSAALSYRKGSSFSIDQTSMDMICTEVGKCDAIATRHAQAAFDTPDIWSLGGAWQPAGDWLLSAQADMVEYSSMADAAADEAVDDGLIVRFGAEKSFVAANDLIWQLRGGLFRVPDHDGFQAIDSDQMHYTLGGGAIWGRQIRADLGASFSEDTFNSVLSLTYSL